MKTDWLRTGMIAGIAFLSFLLVIRWNEFQENRTAVTSNGSIASTPAEPVGDSLPSPVIHDELPEATQPGTVPSATQPDAAEERTRNLIHVRTDVLETWIDPTGGDLVKIALPTFYAKIDTPEDPFILLNRTSNHIYVARSGLVGQNGTDADSSQRPVFSASSREFELGSQDELTVDLSYQQSDDVNIIKRFTFHRGSHVIDIKYLVNNASQQPWSAQIYGQIKRDGYNPGSTSGFGLKPFLGAATSTVDTNYKKMSLKDLRDERFMHERLGGWVAMSQHYFISAWVPPADEKVKYEMFAAQNQEMYYMQFSGLPLDVAPGTSAEKSVSFYAGPKHIKRLEEISPYLDLTVDYSFLWWIAKPLFYTLDAIHGVVKNWGFAIILLTCLVKLLFFYPSATSYRSMAKMRKIQPKMAELKERYGDNRQKFSAEMMKLYKEEKVNPLSGCLPILIQMPVFLALYWVLMESVELRHAPFILWIQDLSVRDPLFILPIIMGATMWIQQKLNPAPPDPMQAKIMQMMPIMFTFLFLFFPAGLVLYWVVNNTLSITQQYFITRRIERS